jgi:hypothetical protein
MFPGFPTIFPIQLGFEHLWQRSPEPRFSVLKRKFSKNFPISLLKKNGEILPGKTKTHGNRWREFQNLKGRETLISLPTTT